MKMSKHVREDRIDRMVYIATHMDFGQTIIEVYHEGVRQCVTDTGIILIKNETADYLITAFVGTVDRVSAIYKSAGYDRMPPSLYNRVIKNKIHVTLQNMTEAEQIAYLRKNKNRKR